MQQDNKTDRTMKRWVLIFFLITASSWMRGANRALLIGIGKYPTGTGWSAIHGDADVTLLKPMLEKRGFTDVKTLINQEATKKAIVAELKALAERCNAGDKVYFHFSGHGQPIDDENEDENADFDESVIPYDAHKYAAKGRYEGQNHLIDDEYNPLLNAIKKKLGAKGQLFVAVDACYSRGMERGGDSDIDDREIVGPTRGTDDCFVVPRHSSYLKRVPKPKRFDIGARMIIVSACLQTERNYEYKTPSGKMYGSLTYYIYTLLKSTSDFTRWSRYFQDEDYRRYRIFQRSQHPTVVEYG